MPRSWLEDWRRPAWDFVVILALLRCMAVWLVLRTITYVRELG